MGYSLKEGDFTAPRRVVRTDGSVVNVSILHLQSGKKDACFLNHFKTDSEKTSVRKKAVETGIVKRCKEVPLVHQVVLITEKPFVTPCTLKRNEFVKNTKNVKSEEKASSHCNGDAFIDYTKIGFSKPLQSKMSNSNKIVNVLIISMLHKVIAISKPNSNKMMMYFFLQEIQIYL
jgi:hypothetical protein